MKRITISVTAEDIEKGERSAAGACPIALACKRAGLHRPQVDDRIDYEAWPKYGHAALPTAAQRFIADFDDGQAVEPFTFEIETIEDDVNEELAS